MTNSEMLNQYIKESGLKRSAIIGVLGISYGALQDKVYNRTEFKASEIEKLANLLNMSLEQKNTVFFWNGVN